MIRWLWILVITTLAACQDRQALELKCNQELLRLGYTPTKESDPSVRSERFIINATQGDGASKNYCYGTARIQGTNPTRLLDCGLAVPHDGIDRKITGQCAVVRQ